MPEQSRDEKLNELVKQIERIFKTGKETADSFMRRADLDPQFIVQKEAAASFISVATQGVIIRVIGDFIEENSKPPTVTLVE